MKNTIQNDKDAILMLNTTVNTYYWIRDIADETAVSEDQWYRMVDVPLDAMRSAVSSCLMSDGIDIASATDAEVDAYYCLVDDILWRNFQPRTVAELVDEYRSRLTFYRSPVHHYAIGRKGSR